MEKVKALLKSKSVMYIMLALLCLLLACLAKDYDYDLFARLIVGENFIEKGVFNYKDFLSYTPTHIWYDHEWGSSIIFYFMFKYLGPLGFVLLQAVLLFFTAFFVMKIQKIQEHAYPASFAFMAGFLILFRHQNPSLIRCHMFSFMFFAMFLYLLEKTRRFNSNLIWLILPIVIIWNNLHGGVVSGLGMIFIYMIGALLSKKPWRKYLAVLLVSTPLLAINPYGVEYLDFLISANTKNRTYITEWWGVFVQRHVMYYYPAFCTAVFTIFLTLVNLFSKKKINITKILALIVTAALGIIHVKLLSLTIIVIASLFYNDIIKLLGKANIRMLNKAVCILTAFAVLYIPFTKPNIAKANIGKFPIIESEFIKLNKIEGNIITEFGLGSYVSYKLYPQNLIYMDGRYEEVYYDREFEKLMNFCLANDKWDEVINEYPTDILMPDKKNPIYEFLKQNKDWKLIFDGPICGIFVRKDEAKSSYIMPSDNIEYYKEKAFENFGKFGKQ